MSRPYGTREIGGISKRHPLSEKAFIHVRHGLNDPAALKGLGGVTYADFCCFNKHSLEVVQPKLRPVSTQLIDFDGQRNVIVRKKTRSIQEFCIDLTRKFIR